MELFEHRFTDDYENRLLNELSIDKLLESSISVSKPRERLDKEYNKLCRIDYMGLSGTTFLDVACNYIESDLVPRKFIELFRQAKTLNDDGIFIKIRILLMYPFASSFFSLIQAESSTHRSAVDSPAFLRDFATLDQVDEATFYASTSISNQVISLKHIQELIRIFGWDDDSPNTVRIRFTPVDVNSSLLIINNSLFSSPYLFAKSKRLSHRLALMAPVVSVDKLSNEITFNHFEDHFRYVWDLDTTMFCEDATAYDPQKPDSLSIIRPPAQVTFNAKASRIQDLMQEQTTEVSPENELQNWKFRMQHILQRFSTDTKPSPSIESVFIACSWDIGKDGKSKPNQYARVLSDWLESDFGSKRDIPLLSIHVLEAALGGSLAQQVYARLREATLAIVIMTKDIESKEGIFYSKPNVLHELGYLMRQLDARRLIILSEDGVEVPSNIRDQVYIDFQSDKLPLCYRDVLIWLNDVSVLSNVESITASMQSHLKRIDDLIINGNLSQSEADEGKRRIGEDLKELIG